MDSLLFALNAVAPIMLMVAIGYILKKIGFMSQSLAKSVNRLVFHLFLPVTLFLNVYHIEDLGSIHFGYVLYASCGILAVFLLAIPMVLGLSKNRSRRGVLLQATFRSNFALVGIPLAQALYGAEGAAVATLMSAVTIPLFNVLAVITLSVFSDSGKRPSVGEIFLNILKNPLIQGIAAGLVALGARALLVRWGISFRLTDIASLDSVLGYLSDLATPLALLALGAQFEFSAVAELRREILFGTVMRTVVTPILGLGVALLCFSGQFSGAHYASFVAIFATPVAVSTVPMTQEMGGDATLAGQLVVWTTLTSAVSIFASAFLLHAVGIF